MTRVKVNAKFSIIKLDEGIEAHQGNNNTTAVGNLSESTAVCFGMMFNDRHTWGTPYSI